MLTSIDFTLSSSLFVSVPRQIQDLEGQGQVLAALDSLNINKATGTDGIPSKALKTGANELSAPL